MQDIQLIQGDCIEKMRDIPDKSVDMFLTDIPYNEVNRRNNGLRELDKDKADVMTFDLQKMLEESIRLTKGSIYVFCGINQVSEIRQFLSNEGLSTRIIVWEKTNPSPMNGDKIWLSGIELCVYGKFPGGVYNGHCRNCVLRYPSGQNKVHPTQKNEKLFMDIIKTSTNENDLVLDCCMGSGTSGVCCAKLGRRFIGIELDRDYFTIAKKRIEDIIQDKRESLF